MDELDQLEANDFEEKLNQPMMRIRIEKRQEDERRDELDLESIEKRLEMLSMPDTSVETMSVASNKKEEEKKQRVPQMA